MADNSTAGDGTDAVTGIAAWFPSGRNDSPGWRLDVVTLLAVIGESSIAEHSQAITASFLCLLPRIIPAPQALLSSTRPVRMPEVNAKMAGVYSGVVLDSVGFFANIIHPLDEFKPFAFKMLEIKHKDLNEAGGITMDGVPATEYSRTFKSWFHRTGTVSSAHQARRGSRILPRPPSDQASGSSNSNNEKSHPSRDGENKTRANTLATGASIGFDVDTERGPSMPQPGILRQRTVSEKVTDYLSNPTLANNAKRPAVPPSLYSPVHILSMVSFLLTIGLIVFAVLKKDGTAIVAIAMVSLAATVVGYASWWQPILMNRSHTNKVPKGDVIIRTREGAFILIRCSEEVARELYAGTEECKYHVNDRVHRALMAFGTVLLMVSVVLLGNCNWDAQVAIGGSYIGLNGCYWCLGLLGKKYFWDLSRYECTDITPEDALHADSTTDPNDQREGVKSFTRTLWFAIRESKRIGWVERSGAAPGTRQWQQWLKEAGNAAKNGDRKWKAVARKDEIMKDTDDLPFSSAGEIDPAEQRAPLFEVPLQRTGSMAIQQGKF